MFEVAAQTDSFMRFGSCAWIGIEISKLQLDVVEEVYNLLLLLPPEADNLTDTNSFGFQEVCPNTSLSKKHTTTRDVHINYYSN